MGLNYVAKLSVDQAIKDAKRLEAEIKKIGGVSMAGYDKKPMTEHQAAMVELAKKKADDARADKAASLATQAALKEEVRLRKEAAAVPRKVDLGNSQAEIDASNAGRAAGSGTVNTAFTSYLQSVKKDFDAGKISAKEYTAELERFSSVIVDGANSTKKVVTENKTLSLSKKELAKDLAVEKLRLTENNAAIKVSAREMVNAKGSIEQRRAALIRLNAVYDRLSASERNSAAGQRLNGIVAGLTNQVKTLEASTGRAQRNVGNYTSAFANGASKAFGALKTVANILPGLGIAGLIGFAVEPIINYISKLDLFKEKLDETKKTRALLNEVSLKGAQDAQTEIVQLKVLYDTAKNTALSTEQRYNAAKKLQDLYPSTFKNYTIEQIELGKTDKAYLSLASAIIATARARASEQKIAENSSRILSDEQQIVDIQIERQKAVERQTIAQQKFNEALKAAKGNAAALQNVYANETVSIEQSKVAKLDKQINDFAKDREILNTRNLALTKNIVKEQLKGADVTGTTPTAAKTIKSSVAADNAALNAQRNLQAEIDALTKKGISKKESEDEQELIAIDEKYKKLKEKAIAYNLAQEKIDADARKKGLRVLGLRVDSGNLDQAQSTEKDLAIDKNDAAKLKITIDKQKQLYDEFENYKLKVGTENAKRLVGDQIASADSYYEYLKQQEEALLNGDSKAKGGADAANNAQQVKLVQDELAVIKELRRKADADIYANAYQSAQTYFQRATEIERDYQAKRKALGESATTEQLANLNREREARKTANNSANAEQLSGYNELLENIDALSRQKAIEGLDKAIAVYDKEYADKLITAKDYYDKIAILENKKTELKGTENNPFAKISESVKAYKKQLNAVDKDSVATEAAQKKMYSAIAEGAGAASAVIGDVAGSLDALGIGGEALQNVLKNTQGILDGAGSIAKGIASGNPVDIITGSIKLLTSAIDLFNTKDKKLEKQIQGYKDQLTSLGAAYAQLDRQVQNSVGESIYTDQKAQIANLLKQQEALKRARDAEASKKKKDQGKIDEYNSQLADIPNKIEDIERAINQNLIQGTFKDLSNSLADAFTEAFKAGENGIAKMDGVFNDFIGNAIKNSLQLKILDPIVKKFTDDLTDFAKNNDNSIADFNFARYKEEFAKKQKEFEDALNKSKEFFTDPKDKDVPKAATGIARAGLSEETGSRIDGIMRAQYDATKLTNTLLTPIGKSMGDLYLIAKGNFDVQLQIEQNTANTVVELKNAVVELKAINTNTKPPIVRGI